MSAADYVHGIRQGDRNVLARAITLVESTHPEDRALARQVLSLCHPAPEETLRIAVTGAPGVGKSTLIEALGKRLVARGQRVAVLAADPTSIRTRGSILGDKTRMPGLGLAANAFVRPSPAGIVPGGVSHAAQQAIQLCEAAGYTFTFVETVGAGQSEVAARHITDVVLLLVLAHAGDELQAIKRGIVETADIITVAKADGTAASLSKTTQRQYQRSIRLFPPGPSGLRPRVLTCSAVSQDGLAQVWKAVEAFEEAIRTSGHLERNRTVQARDWVLQAATDALRDDFLQHPAVKERLRQMQEEVARGKRGPWAAAEELVRTYRCA